MTCKEYDSLTLLSYMAGDLSPIRTAEVRRHLEHCSECSAFIGKMEIEQKEFLEAFPEPPMLKERHYSTVPFRPMTALLSAAAVLIAAFGLSTLLVHRQPDASWRTKGSVALSLYVSDSTGQPSVRKDSVFYPGERIQFTYSCGKERYFILASVDEHGRVSVFYPTSGDSSMVLEPGNGVPLPHSIRLDGYIGLERYIAVFSETPLDVASVKELVKKSVNGTESLRTVPVTISGAKVRSVIINKKENR